MWKILLVDFGNNLEVELIQKLLVANRGEIALRIIRAAKELGIKTVAIHSEADADSFHVHLADEDVCIGPAQSSLSYLNMNAIISAAEVTGADAIHPGYGFLAENADFAQMVEDAGFIWVGPSSDKIRKLGDKTTARKIMTEAGVPCTPGSKDIVHTFEEGKLVADEYGYPIIIKATAGGGGKGMRVCWNDEELDSNLKLAQSEAAISFGNPDCFIEKFIEAPRHIEVQFIGDNFGNVVHLYERDCTVQRRHQKLIEEAPSLALSQEMREKICQYAVDGGKAILYNSAGTMEFLLDSVSGKVYFMEVNTRIQVEHPVTEMVTGIDLIKEMLLVASNEKLSFEQDEITLNGFSMECRINAEDPKYDFRPSPGRIELFHVPGGLGVRVDSHSYGGYMIPPYYDSMIAKLIVSGKTREEVITRMKRALEEFEIEGIKTTIPFHLKMMENDTFKSGVYTTKFLEEEQISYE